MERLKPIDLERAEFKKRLRGYDPVAVREILARCAREIEEQLVENREIREDNERLRAEVESFRAQEATLKEALLLAQRTADETKANAHKEADLILEGARRQAADLQRDLESKLNNVRWDLERVRLERQTFTASFRAMLEDYLRSLSEGEPRLAVIELGSEVETGS